MEDFSARERLLNWLLDHIAASRSSMKMLLVVGHMQRDRNLIHRFQMQNLKFTVCTQQTGGFLPVNFQVLPPCLYR